MFSFFKINDPYRLVAILLIAFAIKIPVFINGNTYFEMHHWLIIGEAMRSGHMYEQIFDTLSPFSATTYWFIELLFGRSVLALQILGTLLVVIHAIIFNNLTINNKVYEQNSYLPAFVYTILASVHYSQTVFSPAQLGLTFVLLAFSKLLSHVEFRAKQDEQIMSIGLLIGIAALFYLPYIMFLPVVLLILLIFTNTLRRRYFILIINALITPALVIAYYALVHSDLGYVYMNLIQPVLSIDFAFFSKVGQNLLLFLPLLLAWLIGFITMPKQRRLNNYQNRLAQLFFLTGIFSISILLFKNTGIDTGLILFVPVAAFFATHLFLLIKSPLTDIGISLLFLVIVLFPGYDTEFNILGLTNKFETEVRAEPDLIKIIENKRLMVLGDKPQLYKYSTLATPFYNWHLAEPVITRLDYYDNLVFLKESLARYQPHIVIDYEFRWRKISNHIPILKSQYREVKPFVWVRINQ